MNRDTIDFGIDLGTTNSAIAVLQGRDTHVFKNNENLEYTPSAVWIDRNNHLFVGRTARERIESDPDNAFSEFKLQMGTSTTYRFALSGREMKPEELSAEVLKSLKASVMQRTQEDVKAAVITVPAAFELHQNKATRQAAELAGLTPSPLLQEPVAAALAYGFQSKSDKIFWLVYDLGGGTFDAAVIQVRDGEIRVVNHGGDNHLGGKLIDWAIVENLFIPTLTQQYKLKGFQRGNPAWISAIAKLKAEAEQAKIRLSDHQSLWIHIPFLGLDEQKHPISFEYELKRSDVEQLMEPFILRSINICKKVLTEKNLTANSIENILLVGGPTLTPYLRERLADKQKGLGIPLEFSIDPLTVVARGAAIFAGTQRLIQDEARLKHIRPKGAYTISFPGWAFQGSDSETTVGGMIKGEVSQRFQGYTVEFINSNIRPPWRSGQIPVDASGSFIASLWVKSGETNTYSVELRDSVGRICPSVTDPQKLSYTQGIVIANIPLTHSIGVALANNEVEWFLVKGQSLPARSQKTLRTAFEVSQGQAGGVIRIPVVEGESPRADRNRIIGRLEVTAQQVRRTVPVGAEVGITIDIDTSRLLRTKANIPLLDEEFEEVLHLGGQNITRDIAHLQQDLAEQKRRLSKLKTQEKALLEKDTEEVSAFLQQIENEQVVREVESALAAAQTDPESLDACDKRLSDLKMVLDQAETALEWPNLIQETNRLLARAQEIMDEYGSREDKQHFQQCEDDIHKAIYTQNADVLQQRVGKLRELLTYVLDKHDILPQMWFEQLCGMKNNMRNQVQAQKLIDEGLRALQTKNIPALRSINQQLKILLPLSLPPTDISTLTR
ncbi:hypothetical protein KSC_023670 [Ktedonobacter sp. SOSP1-52]|uniref:Hsp70 family protein n=1 Tax=Ktedonobacter sp. SOSP1-52 TaxID=2778366 RepID=UPI00191555E2|nr:Hsp70 family protein [Ktedonobacter sp. SOSP1-52]GHO63475.1 hypothetical protein KSC_023670 [Ktedonobacter sp. SOSP1-52]